MTNEQLFLLIILVGTTAALFYHLGSSRGVRKDHINAIVQAIVDDITNEIADEFYPGDSDGQQKVMDRMKKRPTRLTVVKVQQ